MLQQFAEMPLLMTCTDTDNPKLQAEIKEGVRQDKEKRRIQKAKKSS